MEEEEEEEEHCSTESFRGMHSVFFPLKGLAYGMGMGNVELARSATRGFATCVWSLETRSLTATVTEFECH